MIMKKRIGILTSGGDCPGLNATIRGVAKACFENMGEENIEIVGISNGYYGLIHNMCRDMQPSDFSGILTQGGTILGTKRQPFKMMTVIGEDNVDKVKAMKETYKKQKLDCLLTLGGNGTHKTSKLLADEGLHVIGLPKTIDNDIYGTDFTFGFHTAVEVATDAIDRVHSTAESHSRVMIVEIMGNKAGWLTLYSGVAGGADIILIPEIPFDPELVAESIQMRKNNGHNFTIIAVAEGAMTKKEANLKEKERLAKRKELGYRSVSDLLQAALADIGMDVRSMAPSYMQRGGSPCPYDRFLCTKFGIYAASLFEQGIFGVTVALQDNEMTHNLLSSMADKSKLVSPNDQTVQLARKMGISFGDTNPTDYYKKN